MITAFKSVTIEEDGYTAFEKALLPVILSKVESDGVISDIARDWPRIKNNNGNFLDEAYHAGKYNAFMKSGVPEAEIVKLRDLGLIKMARAASEAVFSSAREVMPDIFSNLPEINPHILSDSTMSSGSYYLSPDGKSAAYAFREDMLFAFVSPAKFVASCMHETHHFLHGILARNAEELPNDHSLKQAALVFADEYSCGGGNDLDFPVSLWPVAGCKSELPNLAYRVRPTEHFAYRMDGFLDEGLRYAFPEPHAFVANEESSDDNTHSPTRGNGINAFAPKSSTQP